MGLVLIFAIPSCKKETAPIGTDTVEGTTPYTVSYPDNFPEMFVPSSNPLTVEGVSLGRYLYYDPRLSAGGTQEGRACASCHMQDQSFSSASSGSAVLPHLNLGWANYFLWNGKIGGTLEDIMRFEVKEFFQADLTEIAADPAYSVRYKNAFGSPEITSERTALALAQFCRALTSGNSRFDKYLAHQIQLNASEMNGFIIYYSEKGDCFHCHTLPLMTDNLFHNIGLDSVFDATNSGRFQVTGNLAERGHFKTPTLRNIATTAPYMHDNRFQTLEQVVEHYNAGVAHSATLDPIMTKPSKEFGLQLTENEKADLVAFLHTLTDSVYLGNSALSNPF